MKQIIFCFSSALKQISQTLFKVTSCYCMLLMRLSRFKLMERYPCYRGHQIRFTKCTFHSHSRKQGSFGSYLKFTLSNIVISSLAVTLNTTTSGRIQENFYKMTFWSPILSVITQIWLCYQWQRLVRLVHSDCNVHNWFTSDNLWSCWQPVET
jgi:hypothetical protein